MIQQCEYAPEPGNIEQTAYAAARRRDDHEVFSARACLNETPAIIHEHAHRDRVHVKDIPAIDDERIVGFWFGKRITKVIAMRDVLISVESYV